MSSSVKARIAEYLTQQERAEQRPAEQAAAAIAAAWSDRYFFWSWSLESLSSCVAASPSMTHDAGAVLTRLARHMGVHVSDAYLPHCSRCHEALRLAEVQVEVPTGACRSCLGR